MEVEDRLAAARADVDDHPVVVEAGLARRLGHEVEHPLRLVGRELADVAERVDVPLGDDEQVRLGLRVDVPDRDEAVGCVRRGRPRATSWQKRQSSGSDGSPPR